MKVSFSSFFKVAMLIAVGMVLSNASAFAAVGNTMLLCINDFGTAGSCVSGTGGGSDYLMLESDGTTVTTTASGGTFTIVSEATSANQLTADVCLGGTYNTTTKVCAGTFLTVDTGTRSYTNNPVEDLNYQEQSFAAGTLNVWWSVSGFTGSTFTGGIGGTNSNSTTSYLACIENSTQTDPTNLPVCGTPPPQSDTIGFGSTSASVFGIPFGSSNKATTATFGLEEQIKIVTTGAGVVSGDMQILSSVPEPTSILLLGTVLLVAGRTIRRKIYNA